MDPVSALKVWLFPAVVTVLSTIIWRDVTELKSDVKELLAQSNIDKTRIDALEKQIQLMNQMFISPKQSSPTDRPISQTNLYGNSEFILSNEKRKYGRKS